MNVDLLIEGRSAAEVTAAAYFAIRYVKQASGAHHAKNVFQDDPASLPSDRTVALAMSLVGAVEQTHGKRSELIQGDELATALDELSSIALTYGGRATETDVESALAVIDEFGTGLAMAGK